MQWLKAEIGKWIPYKTQYIIYTFIYIYIYFIYIYFFLQEMYFWYDDIGRFKVKHEKKIRHKLFKRKKSGYINFK